MKVNNFTFIVTEPKRSERSVAVKAEGVLHE